MLIINEIMKKKGLTTSDIAERLEVSRETVSRQINGNPTLETLKRYADVLDVDVADLFRREKKENQRCPHCGKPLNVKIEKAEISILR